MPLPRVIYIAGYGRSGSTLLDIVLSQESTVFSGGELRSIGTLLMESHSLCTCGLSFHQCPVWGKIFDTMLTFLKNEGINALAFQRLQNRIESMFSLILLKASGNWLTANKTELDIYTKFYTKLLSSIADLGFDYVVDSSKTARGNAARPLALQSLVGVPITLIHMVRHPLAVLNSVSKGLNRDFEKGLSRKRLFSVPRACLGWPIANLSASIASQLMPERSAAFIRYEDLLISPDTEINRLCTLIGLNPSPILKWLQEDRRNSERHTLAGNRMRFENVRIDPTRGVSSQKLALSLNWMVSFLLWPLVKKYGYKRSEF